MANLNLDFLLSASVSIFSLGILIGTLKQSGKGTRKEISLLCESSKQQDNEIRNEILSFKDSIKQDTDNIQRQINRLEQKQDKHNSLIERMVVVEQSTKSLQHQIDEHINSKH